MPQTLTLVPVSSTFQGVTMVGGTTPHGVLADDTDASYVSLPGLGGTHFSLNFAIGDLPPRASVLSLTPQFRRALSSGSMMWVTSYLYSTVVRPDGKYPPGIWNTVTVAASGGVVSSVDLPAAKDYGGVPWTVDDLNNLNLFFSANQGNINSPATLTVRKLTILVTYGVAPLIGAYLPPTGTIYTTTSKPAILSMFSDPDLSLIHI